MGGSAADSAVAGSFSQRALDCTDGLEEDNSREYWTRQADTSDRAVRAPLTALLESLPAAYQPFRTFRMNRDLRSARGTSPYKLQHFAIDGRATSPRPRLVPELIIRDSVRRLKITPELVTGVPDLAGS